jgi:hypothetical protein
MAFRSPDFVGGRGGRGRKWWRRGKDGWAGFVCLFINFSLFFHCMFIHLFMCSDSVPVKLACRNDFTTLSLLLLQKQFTVIFLLEETLIPWSLALDECGGHKDLRGSVHRSVIPYIHRRTELYCTSLSCLSLIFPPALTDLFWPRSTSVKWHLPEHFIAQGRAVTMGHESRQVASGYVKHYVVGHNG